MKGQILSGEFGKIIIRQKSDENIELGELLVTEDKNKMILQVYDLIYGSQLSQQNLELISGLKLEENTDLEFLDKELRNYNLALLKPMITLQGDSVKLTKTLPKVFSEVREVTKQDLKFLSKPKNPLFVGKLRSGSKFLDVDIFLDGEKAFSHHILIPATTGRGKSNLTSCMLWDSVGKDYCGILVLDPHDEYYGRNKIGLKDHPDKNKVVYYTTENPPTGAKTLKINLKSFKPHHFDGVFYLTDAQKDAMIAYYKRYREEWIEAVVTEKEVKGDFFESTLAVLKRKLSSLLNIDSVEGKISCKGVFDTQAGESTLKDVVGELEDSKVVIIDTSSFSGQAELLIGSLISTNILGRYKNYKAKGELKDKPVISIVLEEAPRVLGKKVLESGSNIFETIAREGRKFRVGLTAITQLPSLIPREILANINTKIILGVEMAPERQAIIESASQDLSSDNRNIASLDTGEAIITSNFTKFAIPVKIPLFEDFIKHDSKKEMKNDFTGVKLE
ncbi:ATP-binding protein [Candidatus Woesearchaeota archaeon]|nr:ATP-binding protein [Candidatus Woesearchaeota archaeon]